MKKNILRLMFAMSIATTFISCSSDDEMDEISISDAKHFSPPTWVQGKWAYQYNDPDEYVFEFTNDDFLKKIGNMVISNNQQINFMNLAGANNSVIESIKTNTRYRFKIIDAAGTGVEYDLQLQADGSMHNLNDDAFGYYYKRP